MLQGLNDLTQFFMNRGSTSLNEVTNDDNFPSQVGNLLYTLQGSNASNDFTAEQNALNRAWQSQENKLAYERSLEADATAIQRRKADLEAAGFNPIMAVQGLSGGSVNASSSSGSSGSGVAAAGSTVLSALLRGISQIVSSAIRADR